MEHDPRHWMRNTLRLLIAVAVLALVALGVRSVARQVSSYDWEQGIHANAPAMIDVERV
jgi:hypothetical protein